MERRIYVYPGGATGKVLGGMIEYVEGISPIFIDDSIEGFGIEDLQKEIIQNNAVVHLAWDKRSGLNNATIGKIITKLEWLCVSYCEDSFEIYSAKVAQKLENYIKEKNYQKVIGIELGGMAEDKHIGFVDDELREHYKNKQEKVLMVYFCGLLESYERISQKFLDCSNHILALYFSCYYMDILDCLDVCIKVSWTPKSINVKTCVVGHSLSDFSEITRDSMQVLEQYMDYLCVCGKQFMPKFNSSNVTFIESGYLGYDRILKEFQDRNATLFDVYSAPPPLKYLLFAPYDEGEFFTMLPFIYKALEKYGVILRSRTFTEENLWRASKEEFRKLEQKPKFRLDNGWKMSLDSYLDSFVLVCGKTTTKYSYPLLTLKPSLVFSNAINCIDKRLGVVCGFDISCDTFLEYIENIEIKQMEWQEKILSYRNENIYNYGCASKFLADYIAKLI